MFATSFCAEATRGLIPKSPAARVKVRRDRVPDRLSDSHFGPGCLAARSPGARHALDAAARGRPVGSSRGCRTALQHLPRSRAFLGHIAKLVAPSAPALPYSTISSASPAARLKDARRKPRNLLAMKLAFPWVVQTRAKPVPDRASSR